MFSLAEYIVPNSPLPEFSAPSDKIFTGKKNKILPHFS